MFFNGFQTWWRSIDKNLVFVMFFLVCISAIMVTTASPVVAERIGLEQYFFIKRQFIFLAMAIIIIFIISSFSIKLIKISSLSGFIVFFGLMILVLFLGNEIKGAKRWLVLAGITMQPSEFMKPFFTIVNAKILSEFTQNKTLSYQISFIFYAMIVGLLVLQPDIGMSATFSMIWFGQIFFAGISIYLVLTLASMGLASFALAYKFLPHVQKRVEVFFSEPTLESNYQVKRGLEALTSGGLYGKGPGEGVVKQNLPDSHTDFIFAVIAEEMGAIACLLVIIAYAYMVIASLNRMKEISDGFAFLAICGFVFQIGIQAIINIGVSLNLLPTKGMTLPFISYGGSSMLSVAISMGFLLALTRKRFGFGKFNRKFHSNIL